MKNISQITTDAKKGFVKTAKRTPDKARIAIIALVWAVIAGVPAVGIAVAAAGGALTVAARLCGIPGDHNVVIVVFLCTFILALRLIMPLLRTAWAKLAGWEHNISISKNMGE